MHTQVRKQGEIVELVLGLGLLIGATRAMGRPAPSAGTSSPPVWISTSSLPLA